MALMLDPPPSTFPMLKGMARPLRLGFGAAWNCQSRSVPRFWIHRSASMTLGASSSPPASRSRTVTSGSSASRRATTEPDEPDPQTMKSYTLDSRPVIIFNSSSRLSPEDSTALLRSGGRHARPELVELGTVEERECLDDLLVTHREEPCVGVHIRLPVACCSSRVKENDDRVTVGIELSDLGPQGDRHPCVEWANDVTHESLPALICLQRNRSPHDGPRRVICEYIIRTAGSVLPRGEGPFDDGLVARLPAGVGCLS